MKYLLIVFLSLFLFSCTGNNTNELKSNELKNETNTSKKIEESSKKEIPARSNLGGGGGIPIDEELKR